MGSNKQRTNELLIKCFLNWGSNLQYCPSLRGFTNNSMTSTKNENRGYVGWCKRSWIPCRCGRCHFDTLMSTLNSLISVGGKWGGHTYSVVKLESTWLQVTKASPKSSWRIPTNTLNFRNWAKATKNKRIAHVHSLGRQQLLLTL